MNIKNKSIQTLLIVCSALLIISAGCSSKSRKSDRPKINNCTCSYSEHSSAHDACIKAANAPTCYSTCKRGGYNYGSYLGKSSCGSYKWKN
ncbi:MAG: hypothetical protein JAZ19_03805 [Candidatus Thiodiazotropha taylori]|nr:hypothetical protein [Candidatus Thiodiazotropha taylori]